MKHYQDKNTGQIYAFEYDFDPFKSNNRNIPETLSENVIEKPSDLHIWCKEKWIHKKDKPINYKEPISDIPSYNPAWITFLFQSGTVIFNEKNKFKITLDQINTNRYNGKELSKIIEILLNTDDCDLSILISADGSISIPVNDIYNTQEIAVNKINEIIGALFLGGMNLNSIHLGDLEQGTLLEGGEYNFSYTPSEYNRFRNNGASISELAIFLNPHYIQVQDIKLAYNIGIDLIKSIPFSPIFLVQGYHSMQLWKTADALSDLWIVIEQLTKLIWDNQSKNNIMELLKRLNIRTKNIEMKHKVFFESKIISNESFQILNIARTSRNKLLHEGKLPEHKIVENLWIVLFDMFELSSGKKLDKLYSLTVNKQTKQLKRFYNNNYDKKINSKNTNFDEWNDLQF